MTSVSTFSIVEALALLAAPAALLAAAAYCAAAWMPAAGAAHLRGRRAFAALAAVVAHTVALLPALLTDGGLQLGVWLAASLIGWQCALLLTVVGTREPLGALAKVVFSVAALTVIAGLLMPSSAAPITGGPLIAGHIITSILGYGLLTLAFVQAGVVWLADAQLRQPAADSASNLPPLVTLERLLFLLIAVGFVLLSASLITGLVVTKDIYGQHLTHKTAFTLTAWLVFGALLIGRWRYGWRGRVATRWTWSGYASLVLAYFGSKLVLALLLGESW